MNRKQKIILSITGIILVSLILIGLTYAYFLTKITGNTNEKSISVSTANLAIVYDDNSAEILGKDLILEPNSEKEIGTKTFTVTNKGNAKTSYVVVIDETKITNATDGTTTTFESNDFRYTLTCTEGCNGVETQSVFPINGGVLVGNSIDVGIVQTYELKLWYIDTGIDQTKDMNKRLEARVNITDISQMENPYSANKNSLAYNIIENAKNKTNGTELLSNPRSRIAEAISQYGTGKFEYETVTTESLYVGYNSWSVGDSESDAQSGSSVSSYDDAVGKYVYDRYYGWTKYLVSYDASSSTLKFKSEEMQKEVSMSTTLDDYGTSYYYRGNVIDNYVNFAGMCWRIVRIAGDGSIKLILEDQDNTCATSDGNWNIPTTTGGTTKTGSFGYTVYDANTLTASDGTKNSSGKYLMNYLNSGTNNDKSMASAFKNFQIGTLANYLDKLKVGNWCLNDKAYVTSKDNTTPLTGQEILDYQIKNSKEIYYDSYVRLNGKRTKEPTLKCNGTNMSKFADNTDMYVGTLTADEIVYAGGKVDFKNQNYYLINDYQKSNSLWFWSLSPSFFVDGEYDCPFYVDSNGNVDDYNRIVGNGSFRPAIQLKSSVQITSGNGTKENPYKILEN